MQSRIPLQDILPAAGVFENHFNHFADGTAPPGTLVVYLAALADVFDGVGHRDAEAHRANRLAGPASRRRCSRPARG